MNDYIHKFIEKTSEHKKPFDEMAKELGIENSVAVAAATAGDFSQAPTKRKNKNIFLRWAGLAASILIIATSIALSAILPITPPGSSNDPLPIFSAYDSRLESITLQYWYELDNVLLFNKDQILNAEDGVDTFRHVVRDGFDEAGMLLGYSANQMIFLTSNEENAFLIDFRVKVYRYYMFVGYGVFNELYQYFTINDVIIYYILLDQGRAQVRFVYGGLEYFLTIESFFEEDITKQSLSFLLGELIPN